MMQYTNCVVKAYKVKTVKVQILTCLMRNKIRITNVQRQSF